MRSAFAHQIRKPVQSACAGRRSGGFGEQFVIRHTRRELFPEPMQTETGPLGHTHDVPLVAHRVTEGMHASLRIVRYVFHVREDDPRSSQRARDRARFHNTIAHGARGLITTAAGHGSAGSQARQRRCAFRDRSRDIDGFIRARKNCTVQAQAVHHFQRPAAANDIEHCSSRRVGNLGREFARQSKTNVILGQQNMPYMFEILRLMIAHPQQFRQRKSSQHWIGGMFDHLRGAQKLIDPIHLRLAALVAPDQRWADDFVIAIENHQPVHLPRKSDAPDLIAVDSGGSQRTANRFECRVGPVLRALLGPQRLLHHDVFVSNRDRGSFPSARIQQDRA